LVQAANVARRADWPRLAGPLLALAYFLAVLVAFAFIALPLIAIFVHVGPGKLVDQLSNPIVTDALVVTLKTALVAQALILLFGTPVAYLLASRRFLGRSLLITLVELPIVLPPAVAGVGLLVAYGRVGLLGSTFRFLGFDVSFNATAVIFAVMLVAGPFYVRQAIAAFEAVDENLVAASRTLGAGPLKTFFRVTMPLAGPGLAAGWAICFARGLGEFGATIMFAGSLQGTTQTLSLAIYYAFDLQNGLDVALSISALLVVVSAAVLLTVKLLALRTGRSTGGFLGIAAPGRG
jgi:molybdate transport system permease protein